MPYNREILEELLEKIPKGKVTTHKLLGGFFDTTARAVSPAICRYRGEGRFRIVMKNGFFPHPENDEDCLHRAELLRSEGLEISENNHRVKIKKGDIWQPKL